MSAAADPPAAGSPPRRPARDSPRQRANTTLPRDSPTRESPRDLQRLGSPRGLCAEASSGAISTKKQPSNLSRSLVIPDFDAQNSAAMLIAVQPSSPLGSGRSPVVRAQVPPLRCPENRRRSRGHTQAFNKTQGSPPSVAIHSHGGEQASPMLLPEITPRGRRQQQRRASDNLQISPRGSRRMSDSVLPRGAAEWVQSGRMPVPSRVPPSPLLSHWNQMRDAADAAPRAGAPGGDAAAGPPRRPLPAAGGKARRNREPELVLRDAGLLHAGLQAVRMHGQPTREWVVSMAQLYEARIAALEEELQHSAERGLEAELLRGMHNNERTRCDRYEHAYFAMQQLIASSAMQGRPKKGGAGGRRLSVMEEVQEEADAMRAAEELRRQQSQNQRQASALTAERDHALEQLKTAKNQIKLKEKMVEQLMKKMEQLTEKLTKATEQLAKVREEFETARVEWERETVALKAALKREQEKVQKLEEKMKKAREEFQKELKRQAEEMTAAFEKEKEKLERERDAALEKVKVVEDELKATQERLKESEARREEAERRAASADELRNIVVSFNKRVDSVIKGAADETNSQKTGVAGATPVIIPATCPVMPVGPAEADEPPPLALDAGAQPSPGALPAAEVDELAESINAGMAAVEALSAAREGLEPASEGKKGKPLLSPAAGPQSDAGLKSPKSAASRGRAGARGRPKPGAKGGGGRRRSRSAGANASPDSAPPPCELTPQQLALAAQWTNPVLEQALDQVHCGVQAIASALHTMSEAVVELSADNERLTAERDGLQQSLEAAEERAARERAQLEEQTRVAERKAGKLARMLEKLKAHGDDELVAEAKQRDMELAKELKEAEKRLHLPPEMNAQFKGFLNRMDKAQQIARRKWEQKRNALINERTRNLEEALLSLGVREGDDYPQCGVLDVELSGFSQLKGWTSEGARCMIRLETGLDSGGAGGGLSMVPSVTLVKSPPATPKPENIQPPWQKAAAAAGNPLQLANSPSGTTTSPGADVVPLAATMMASPTSPVTATSPLSSHVSLLGRHPRTQTVGAKAGITRLDTMGGMMARVLSGTLPSPSSSSSTAAVDPDLVSQLIGGPLGKGSMVVKHNSTLRR